MQKHHPGPRRGLRVWAACRAGKSAVGEKLLLLTPGYVSTVGDPLNALNGWLAFGSLYNNPKRGYATNTFSVALSDWLKGKPKGYPPNKAVPAMLAHTHFGIRNLAQRFQLLVPAK